MEQSGRCRCNHHKLIPLCIFLIGLTLLLGNLAVLSAQLTGILWPVFLGVIGLTKMTSSYCTCCNGCACSSPKRREEASSSKH